MAIYRLFEHIWESDLIFKPKKFKRKLQRNTWLWSNDSIVKIHKTTNYSSSAKDSTNNCDQICKQHFKIIGFLFFIFVFIFICKYILQI